MRAVVMYAQGDVRVDQTERPTIVEPTDAIIKLAATCICGSDLWPYRGADDVDHQPMGHEYAGVVDEVGADVVNVEVGDFVVGSFFSSDNTCEICQAGYQTHCVHGGPAPVRRFLPELIQLIWDRKIDPGKVFDLTLPLEQAAEGYQAMDKRTATKVLLTV